jgi:hypothetical protein
MTALLLVAASGCERDPIWQQDVTGAQMLGMDSGVAIVDPAAERALLLTPAADLSLGQDSFTINTGFATTRVTPDGSRLLVLSHGVVPRQRADDPEPMLETFASAPSARASHRYVLSDPLSGLALDPMSQFAVVHAQGDSAFLQNPNELAVIDLLRAQSDDNPVHLTLRSFGGTPQAFTFTKELVLPGGKRRLLVVQTDRDVALVDLNTPSVPEITIPLSSGSSKMVPGGLAISDGAIEKDDDARIAIRLQGDSSVIIVDLKPLIAGEEQDTPQTFRAVPNVVFVDGIPSDIAFVQTDGGLRLAALLGQRLTLVNPATGIASSVDLGSHTFSNMTLVTDVVATTSDGSDVAMLWSPGRKHIALVAFGSTVGQPYKAIEHVVLDQPVSEVAPVGGDNPHLRILRSASGGAIHVLDLLTRTAAPLHASSSSTSLTTSADGGRAWLSHGAALARLDLSTLHPENLLLRRPISHAFDVQLPSGGSALIALHDGGAMGATVLDAAQPSLSTAREYAGLLLGELP